MDAIVIRSVGKQFRRKTIGRESSTLKTELVKLLTGRRKRTRLPTIQALDEVSLTVPAGQTLGLIGRNGSGKSTLLKLVTGIYAPTTGSIEVHGRLSALLELGAGFHPDFSGRENILINGIILGMSRKDIRARMDEIIEFSELREFIDQPVRTYSSGMYMRLAFTIATHVDPDILIVDEILAVGDEHFRAKSQAKMDEFRQKGKTILMVSHSLEALQAWCDQVAWLDRGRLKMVGDPVEVVGHYREEISRQARAKGLPATGPLEQPRSGPPAEPGRRWGSFGVELERVSLRGPTGAEQEQFEPQDPLTVALQFRAFRQIAHPVFKVAIRRHGGPLLWETRSPSGDEPLPEEGSIRLTLPRLGLVPGRYVVDVSVFDAETCCDAQSGLHGFSVVGDAAAPGLVAPEHAWSAPLGATQPVPDLAVGAVAPQPT